MSKPFRLVEPPKPAVGTPEPTAVVPPPMTQYVPIVRERGRDGENPIPWAPAKSVPSTPYKNLK